MSTSSILQSIWKLPSSKARLSMTGRKAPQYLRRSPKPAPKSWLSSVAHQVRAKVLSIGMFYNLWAMKE
jgi:hypothetical protein